MTTDIDILDLQTEFVRLPGELARQNEEVADCMRVYLQCKRNKEALHSALYLRFRESHSSETKRVTEAFVEALIDNDPLYAKACGDLIEAEVDLKRAQGRAEALRAKKDALVSIGAHMRAEMSHLSIRRDE